MPATTTQDTRGRRDPIAGFRLTADDRAILRELCEALSLSKTAVVRIALRDYHRSAFGRATVAEKKISKKTRVGS